MSHRPPMNWQERARRAEMIAERLAKVLGDIVTTTWPAMDDEEVSDAQAALDAWHQHRADLDTLAQAQQEGR